MSRYAFDACSFGSLMLKPTEAPGPLRAAVRRLHHPRPAAGHHREPFPGETRRHLGGESAPAMGLGEPGGAEDRHGRGAGLVCLQDLLEP